MASLGAVNIEIKLQLPVVAGSSSKSVQPLPAKVIENENISDIAVPGAHMELSENARIAFSTLSDGMKAGCSLYDSDF